MSEQNQNKITQEQFLEKQQLLETEMRQQSSLIAALQQQLLSATQNTKRDGINEENSSVLVEAVIPKFLTYLTLMETQRNLLNFSPS
jgi:hypothetical protein